MSLGDKVKKVLGAVAPLLGSAVGGPLGGVAMKFIADRFTGGDTGQVEDFLLAANPETLKALKVAEMDFKKEMEELGIKEQQLHAEDRDSARQLAKDNGLVVQATISALYTIGYFGVLFAYVFGLAHVEPANKDMTQILIGALAAPQIQILNFWFGSSRGSKDKTSALVAATNGGQS